MFFASVVHRNWYNLMKFLELFSSALHFLEDILGFCRPNKRGGSFVIVSQVFLEGTNQIRHAVKDAAPQALFGHVSKEALHHIEPGRAGGREMQVKARTLGQPSLHRGMLMRRVIVQDQVELTIRRRLLINQLEELQPLLMTMTVLAL